MSKEQESQVQVTVELKKANPRSRTVTGWAAVVTRSDGQPVIDSDEHIIPIEVLEKAVHQAFASMPGRGKVGINHEQKNAADLVGSFVLTAEKRQALGLGESGQEGWIVDIQINDPEIMQRIESGELRELSLKGMAKGKFI